MRLSHSLVITTIMLISISCYTDNPLFSSEASDITLSITLPRGEAAADYAHLGKVLTVASVTLTVSGPDMKTIEKALTISSNGESASGKVEVPKGKDRTFAIECFDENNVVQYSGSTTQDITEDTETVTITTEGHYPNAVTVSVDAIRSFSVDLTWSRNSDPDFAAYDIVRSEEVNLLPANRELLVRIFNRNNTTYSDTSARLNQTYYYGVIVWDTEGLGMRSSSVGVKTPRWAELIYDDGEPTSGYHWLGTGQGSASLLTTSAPARLLSARYYLTNITEGGGFTSVIIGYDNQSNLVVLGSKAVEATETGWIDVLYLTDGVIVEGNFFVMIMYDGVNKPYFGYDPVDNNRAWDYDGTSWSEWDETYFMRAWVEYPGSLLKELAPGDAAQPAVADPRLTPDLLRSLFNGAGSPVNGGKSSLIR